jgi:hypothetical protein
MIHKRAPTLKVSKHFIGWGMLQIQRGYGVVSRSSHDPSSTTGAASSGRQALAATGYWLLWVLCAGAYWRTTSPAVADAVWIAPLLLWLTVFKVAPVPSIAGRLQPLATILATVAFVSLFLACFDWWSYIADAFRFPLNGLKVSIWSVIVKYAAAAIVVSLFLVGALIGTLRAPARRVVCCVIAAALLWVHCQFLLHPVPWRGIGTQHMLRLYEALVPGVIFYGVSSAASLLGPLAVASIRRHMPSLLADYWAGKTSPWALAAIYVLGLTGMCRLIGWSQGFVGHSANEAALAARFCFAWPVALGLIYAVTVPLWRSVQRPLHSHTNWSRDVRGVVFAVSAVIGAFTIVVVAPGLGYLLPMVAEHALHSDWRVEIVHDPAALSLRGDINYGLADALQASIKEHPELKSLHLYSEGGLLTEAVDTAQIVRRYGLNTYVMRECASACTLIFAAGQQRILAKGGKLGFHAPRGGTSFSDTSRSENSEAKLFAEYGIDAEFTRKTTLVPAEEVWYPTIEELRKAHVITAIE